MNDSAFPYGEDQGLGLTKREYFAAMALQGMLANPSPFGTDSSAALNVSEAADYAVSAADALIKWLDKSTKPTDDPDYKKLHYLD